MNITKATRANEAPQNPDRRQQPQHHSCASLLGRRRRLPGAFICESTGRVSHPLFHSIPGMEKWCRSPASAIKVVMREDICWGDIYSLTDSELHIRDQEDPRTKAGSGHVGA